MNRDKDQGTLTFFGVKVFGHDEPNEEDEEKSDNLRAALARFTKEVGELVPGILDSHNIEVVCRPRHDGYRSSFYIYESDLK